MIIQIVLIIFIIFAGGRVIRRWRAQEITRNEFLFWLAFWLLAALLIAWPETLNRLADLLGVGRGADVVVYFSLALIFYLVFRLVVKIEKLEREITSLVRRLAIDSALSDKSAVAGHAEPRRSAAGHAEPRRSVAKALADKKEKEK